MTVKQITYKVSDLVQGDGLTSGNEVHGVLKVSVRFTIVLEGLYNVLINT